MKKTETGGDRSRRAWIDAAKQVVAGDSTPIPCPRDAVGFLKVAWIPFPGDDAAGEYHLVCETCGAENYVLVRNRDRERSEPPDQQLN